MTDDRWEVPAASREVWDALDGLAPEPVPAAASDRIERALTPALIALSSAGGSMMTSGIAVAAAVVLALAVGGAAGFGLGATRGSRAADVAADPTAAAPTTAEPTTAEPTTAAPTPALGGRNYLLLVHDTEAVDRAVREQGMDAIVDRYTAWARGLAEQGRLVGAEHLTATPHWIGDGAPASSSISGFFLIRAASRDEALDIARRSPHAELGGILEVRGTEGPDG